MTRQRDVTDSEASGLPDTHETGDTTLSDCFQTITCQNRKQKHRERASFGWRETGHARGR